MIRYSLKCKEGHGFESWFQSGEAFETLKGAGLVECPHCGSKHVEKAMMAPRVAAKSTEAPLPAIAEETSAPISLAPEGPVAEAISNLRKAIAENSENVGKRFAHEVRAIADGLAPERAIHGEAKPDEAKALLEDGLPVLPLPFRVDDKPN